MVFLIDLPRLTDGAEHKPTAFSSELSRFLKACQVDEKLVDSLTNYDFSCTERLGFVHTMFVNRGRAASTPPFHFPSSLTCENLPV